MSVGVAFTAMALGAALVGLWCAVRFPQFLAWSIGSAAYALALVCLLLASMSPLTGLAMAHVGVRGALLLVVFPMLTIVFWATGCVVRLAFLPARDAP